MIWNGLSTQILAQTLKKYNDENLFRTMKITNKQIKAKQCEEWIASGKAILRNDLGREEILGWANYYLLDTGELLLVDIYEKRNGVLYKSLEEYQELKRRFDKKQALIYKYGSPKDASFNSYLLIKVEDFTDILPQSTQLLEASFSLKPKSLDYSIKSLKLLSNAMKKTLDLMDADEFEEKYVFLITAYCGEVIRKQIDGEWIIKGNEEGMVYQVLVIEKGKPEYSYKPEIALARILAGDVPNRLDIEVGAQLYKYGFIKGNEAHYGIK